MARSAVLSRSCLSAGHPVGGSSPRVPETLVGRPPVRGFQVSCSRLWSWLGFRSIAKSYFRRAGGVLLLYDVTCETSFLNVREWEDTVEAAAHESISIVLVGNKADLHDAAEAEGQKHVPGYLGEKLAMTYGALFCKTNAKDGSNIVEAVFHLSR
ncbi:ras and EF-hand domain-containing protein-like [Eubalaena glacialis]|uniref:ras and EF-hand domain-containing protein-like n=1 Tax=Eubalaena glacialis TaxID=27606 RepID=UPI002A5A6AD8|nr:ras and EF-hand domain-containing protein-like [Eubalaena glacialis]